MAVNVDFGIDDLKIGIFAGATPPTTLIDVPARALSLDTESDSEDFEADNKIIATRRYNKKATGSLESAVTDPATLAFLGSGAVVNTGTAGNTATTYTETNVSTSRNIAIVARALAGDGSVLEITVFKALITSGPNFDWSTGSFSGVTADWESVGNTAGDLWSVASLLGTYAVTDIGAVYPIARP